MTATIDYLSPAEIEQMKFGSLDGMPILYSVNRSYALTATPRGKGWIPTDQSAAGEATVPGERQFFKCFGSDLPPLPELMRKFDPRLWLVHKEGLVFRRFLRKKRPSHGLTTELCPPAGQVVVPFAERKAERKRLKTETLIVTFILAIMNIRPDLDQAGSPNIGSGDKMTTARCGKSSPLTNLPVDMNQMI